MPSYEIKKYIIPLNDVIKIGWNLNPNFSKKK